MIPRLLVSIAALQLLTPSGLSSDAETPLCGPLRAYLQVEAPAASDAETERLRQGLFASLVGRSRCEVTLVPEPHEADLVVELELLRWLKTQKPGGAPQLDPQTGLYVSGSVHQVELRYGLDVRREEDPPPEKPPRPKTLTESVADMTNPLWDPLPRLEAQLHRSLADRVAKGLCKEVSRIERRWRKACAEREDGD